MVSPHKMSQESDQSSSQLHGRPFGKYSKQASSVLWPLPLREEGSDSRSEGVLGLKINTG